MRTDFRAEAPFGVAHLLRYLIAFAAALALVAGLFTVPPAHAQEAPDAEKTTAVTTTESTAESTAESTKEKPADKKPLGDAAEDTLPAEDAAPLPPAEQAAAEAASPVVISDIQVINDRRDNSQDETLIQWQHTTVKWKWEATGPIVEGQTFELEFPTQLRLYHDETFILTALDDPPGMPNKDNGTCVATAASPSKVVCTFGKRFVNKDDVKGEGSLAAQAYEAWDQEGVDFRVNGSEVKRVRLPGPKGTIIGQLDEAPKYPVKWGWYNDDQKTISWRIHVPGTEAAKLGDKPMVIDDALTGHAHKYIEGTLVAGEYGIIGTIDHDTDLRTREPEVVLESKVEANGSQAKVTITAPAGGWKAEKYYVINYKTVTADGQPAPFEAETKNKADIGGIKLLERGVKRSQSGQGTIEGVDRRSVEVHKKLAADSAPVPAGTVFSVLAEYKLNGKDTKEYLEVPLDGSAKGKQELPKGTKVVLSEPSFPTVAGLTFEKPVFAPLNPNDPNVKILDDGAKAEVNVVNSENVQVMVTNKAVTDKASFSVAKNIAGLTDELADHARTKAYTFDYKCGTGEDGVGTITVKGDGAPVAVGKSFPVGTECTITEDVETAKIDGVDLNTEKSTLKQTLKLGPEAGAVVQFTFTNAYADGGIAPRPRDVPWWLLLVPFALGSLGAGSSNAGSSQSGGTNNKPADNATNQTAQGGDQGKTTPAASDAKQQNRTLANTGASVLGIAIIALLAVAAGVFLIRRGRKQS